MTSHLTCFLVDYLYPLLIRPTNRFKIRDSLTSAAPVLEREKCQDFILFVVPIYRGILKAAMVRVQRMAKAQLFKVRSIDGLRLVEYASLSYAFQVQRPSWPPPAPSSG